MKVCSAQEIRVPSSATAGDDATISTAGNGRAAFYLLGPGVSRKSDVSLGEEIHLQSQDLRRQQIQRPLSGRRALSRHGCNKWSYTFFGNSPFQPHVQDRKMHL